MYEKELYCFCVVVSCGIKVSYLWWCWGGCGRRCWRLQCGDMQVSLKTKHKLRENQIHGERVQETHGSWLACWGWRNNLVVHKIHLLVHRRMYLMILSGIVHTAI